jgi:predicted DsbA family dithiol-disulfide isomerase
MLCTLASWLAHTISQVPNFIFYAVKWSAFKLGPSRRSSTSDRTAHVAMGLDVEAEVKQLVEEIKRLGTKGPDGKTSVRHRTG